MELKQIFMLAIIAVAVAGIGTALVTEQQSLAKSTKGDNGSGTGCAVNGTGFVHSHGKCFHPENHINKTPQNKTA